MNKATYVTTVKAILKQNPNAFRVDVIQMVNKDDPSGVGEVYDELKRQAMAPKAKPAAFFQDTTPILIDKLMKHPENERLLPPLSSEERALLKEKMSQELEPQPFVVVSAGDVFYVLDGNNRLDILLDMGFSHTVPCIIKNGLSVGEQRTYIEKCSLARRNLSKEDKAEIAKRQAARGIAQAEIAKNLGVSQGWVSEQTSEIKNARKEAEKKAVVELKEVGLTNREIAKEVGTDEKTVRNFIRNDNFPQPTDAKNEPQKQAQAPKEKGSALQSAHEKISEDAVLKKAKENKLEERRAGKRTAETLERNTKAMPVAAAAAEKKLSLYILTESTDVDDTHWKYIVVCAESSEEAENYNPITNRFNLNEYSKTNTTVAWAQSSNDVIAQLIGMAAPGVAKGDVAWRAQGFNIQNI